MSSRTRRRSTTVVAALAALSALALAACSSSSGRFDQPERVVVVLSQRDHDAARRVLPEPDPRTGLVGLQEGFFKDALKPLGVTVTPTAFNAGPDAVTRAVRRLARHHLHRPEPDDQRLRPVQGRGGQGHRRRGLRRRRARREPGDHQRRPTSRARRSPRPQLGNTQDVALRYWLKQQGLSTRRRGRRRRVDHAAGQLRGS